MSTQDRDKWIHECFVENYDILVVRARRRAGNDPILRNEIEDCVIEAFEMAWNKYDQLKHHPCILGWLTQTVYNKIDNLRVRASTKTSRQAVDIDDPAVMQIEDKRAQERLEADLCAECERRFGTKVKLEITLTRTEQTVRAEKVLVILPAACTSAEQSRIAAYLQQELGMAPILEVQEGTE